MGDTRNTCADEDARRRKITAMPARISFRTMFTIFTRLFCNLINIDSCAVNKPGEYPPFSLPFSCKKKNKHIVYGGKLGKP